LIGPWSHAQTFREYLHDLPNGEREMPANGAMDLTAHRLAFFDRYLKGDELSIVQKNPGQVYIKRANRWLGFPSFPVPNTKVQPLYLSSGGDARSFPGDGALAWSKPEDEPVDRYHYDPNLPTPFEPHFLGDRRELEIRSDVLVYTSAPMDKPLIILGEMTLVLHAASDCPDTDWFATITEVFPDGRSVAFHGIWSALRARYRAGLDKEVLLSPNKPYEFRIPLGPCGHQIATGHRLRLSLCSSAFPAYDVNTNTGHAAATDTEARVAQQTIFHDSVRPSHLLLPTIE